MTMVSICVAASDRTELLFGRCLRSIMNQTYQDYEIVIVGDFIDPVNEDFVRTKIVGESRIKFENLPSRGPYPEPGKNRWRVAGTNAINRALELCSGEYICHLDDDDEITPDKLEYCLKAVNQTNADFIWHPFYTQYPNGQWKWRGNGRFEEGQITTGSVFYSVNLPRLSGT